jgi:hypothetical protein
MREGVRKNQARHALAFLGPSPGLLWRIMDRWSFLELW